MHNEFSGLLEDTRPAEEKRSDYRIDEVASAPTPVQWVEKPIASWNHFEIFNQDGSSSCVANATAKALGIENYREEKEFVRLSARDIYTQRANFPAEGMHFIDAMGIATKKGATLEAIMSSEGKSEEQMNSATDRKIYKSEVAKIFKAGGYVQLPFYIDDIASILSQGKPVLIGFTFTYNEWNDVPTVISNVTTIRHAVVAVDYTLWQGKKAIIIEDSWGLVGSMAGRRIITEDFLSKRCIFAGYFLDLSNDWRNKEVYLEKPHYTFEKVLRFGFTDTDIRKLQEILRYEEMFPLETEITGYYGAITAKGVLQFQKKYEVATSQELEELQGRVCGAKTLSKLNALYGN